MPQFSIAYDNDTGPGDEGFAEWYDLARDGDTIGRINRREDAEAIVAALNALQTQAPGEWMPVSVLDKTNYWFGLVCDVSDGCVRLRLWNPSGQHWEHPDHVAGRFVRITADDACPNPTHIAPLPSPPVV